MITLGLRMRKVDSRYGWFAKLLAELTFIVHELEFLNDVVHDEIWVNLLFLLLVFGLTDCDDFFETGSFFRVDTKHGVDEVTQFHAVFVMDLVVLASVDSVEQII